MGKSQRVRARADLGLEAHPALYDGQLGFGELEHSGLVVDRVRKDGPAARAGIQAGDVLLQFEQNSLFSLDDLWDLVSTCPPGSERTLLYLRADKICKGTIRLGRADASPGESTFNWDYAGLAQLSLALERAVSTGQNLLVGLSGSDT
jgi:S1-C subfamily serine protease